MLLRYRHSQDDTLPIHRMLPGSAPRHSLKPRTSSVRENPPPPHAPHCVSCGVPGANPPLIARRLATGGAPPNVPETDQDDRDHNELSHVPAQRLLDRRKPAVEGVLL